MNTPKTSFVYFKEVTDQRGTLCFGQFSDQLPFVPQRVFYFHSCPEGTIRGEHAHKQSRQVHICMHGSVTVLLDDGKEKSEIVLDNPNVGFVIEPMMWHSIVMGKDACLFVLTTDVYDESDYIRDYAEFLRLSSTKPE